MASGKHFPRIVIAVVLTVLILGALCWWWLGPVAHALVTLAYSHWWLIFALVIIGAGLYAADEWCSIVPAIACAGIAFVVALGSTAAASYVTDRAYLKSVRVEGDAGSLSFEERAPWDVADQVSSRNLGATTGNQREPKTYLATEGVWTASVERRGFATGYEAVQVMRIPLKGAVSAKDVSFCKFNDKADRKLSGIWPNNSLDALIARRTGLTVTWDKDDAYAICDGDTPRIVVPLTKTVGFPYPHKAYGGTAVYDGRSGELTVTDDPKVPGPSYPMSLMARQRSALRSTGSWWDMVFDRAGWRTTMGDEDDPNGANRSEITLATTGGKGEYVTPLTMPGSSNSIVALATGASTPTVKAGGLNALTVGKYSTPRQANSAVAQSITGDILEGYKATGLKVFEVTPAKDGTWTASIGKAQTVLYRATIARDGTIRLDGDEDGENGTNDDSKPSLGDIESDSDDLSSMNAGQIRERIQRLLDELSRRAEDTGETR